MVTGVRSSDPDQGPFRSSIRTGDQRRTHRPKAAEGQVSPEGVAFINKTSDQMITLIGFYV